MATLYRKYRPQNFEEVVGQNHIKLMLEHEIESSKLAHAYLFCGPRAVGKTTLARVLAKAVNCTERKEGEHNPCNKCDSCRDITIGRSLDIIEIDAASHTGVDNVRENIIAQARVAPSREKYKVFIIDEVHMLSLSAFNALLKVLEEPPTTVIFILCTTEIHKVPTTIISRCQRFDFKRISVTDVVRKLSYIAKSEKIKIDKPILESIARQSGGHMRDAESMLGQIVSVASPEHGRGGGKEITQEEADLVIPRSDIGEVINLIDCLSKKNAQSALMLINKLVDQGVDLKAFLDDLIEVLRKMAFAKISPGLLAEIGLELGEAMEIKINEVNKSLVLDNLIAFIEQFIKAKNELRGAFIVQLPIEIAAIKLCLGININASANASAPPSAINPLRSSQFEQQKRINISAEPVKPIMHHASVKGVQLMAKWNEVLARVKKYNHSLSFILRVCEPRELNNNRLCLAFKYKFHKDRVNDPKIRGIIEKVLAEVYGASLTIETLIDEGIEMGGGSTFGEAKAETNESDSAVAGASKPSSAEITNSDGKSDLIDNLLKTFGGKVIN